MAIRIYHQCGHNAKWNKESMIEDNCGDGLIFSPVHQKKDEIQKFDRAIIQKSIFDPQYYLPNSQKNKLKTYDFFPETLTDGFVTADFGLLAMTSAQKCVDFQIKNNFDRIIIPARFFDQMDPDYTSKQASYTVSSFLKVLETVDSKKEIFLTLPMTSHMILSETYRTMLLNWVTSFPRINGIYLFVANGNDEKQFQSEAVVFNYLEFLRSIKEAELKVLLGYSNTESLLATLVGDLDLTFGSFENTRMFSIDKFIISEEDRRGPKPRIYLPTLLNWLQLNQAKDIRNLKPKIWSEIYSDTKYANDTLSAATEPTFNQPSLYRHHFICLNRQIKELEPLNLELRYKTIKAMLVRAIELVEQIENIPYDLEKHGRGDHLQSWLNALNKYYNKNIKV